MADPIVTDVLTIDFYDLEQILTPVGYPAIGEAELPISFEDIVRLCVNPAMMQYSRYNPFTLKTQTVVGLSFEIPFPTLETYGVVGSRIALYQNGSNSQTGNFYNDVRFLSPFGAQGGRNGFPINRDTLLLQEADARTWVNLRKAGQMDVDEEARVVRGSSSAGGELEITWAVTKDTFSSVPFSKKPDVIRLASAYLLRFIGMLDSQQENNTGLSFDASNFLQRAEDLETKVMAKWVGKTKAVVLKG